MEDLGSGYLPRANVDSMTAQKVTVQKSTSRRCSALMIWQINELNCDDSVFLAEQADAKTHGGVELIRYLYQYGVGFNV